MYMTGEPKEMLKIIQDTLTILRQESFLLLFFLYRFFFGSIWEFCAFVLCVACRFTSLSRINDLR